MTSTLLALALAAAAPDADGKIGIAVLDLEAKGDVQQLSATISALAGTQLDKTGVFQVITQDDVRQLVGFDQMKTALSCDEQASCLGEIGEALGVPYVLTGTVSSLDGLVIVNLVVVDIRAAKTIKREALSAPTSAALLEKLPDSVERAVAPLLQAQRGSIAVIASEEGAAVLLDGVAIGSTPLSAVEVGSGPHRISIEKEGFIRFERDVRISPHQRTDLEAKLVPSPTFLEAYKARTGLMRTTAWGTAAGAVLSGVGSGAVWVGNVGWLWGLHAERVGEANTPVGLTREEGAARDALRITTGALAVTAVALAATSVTLFVIGDPPDRYDLLVEQQHMGSGR